MTDILYDRKIELTNPEVFTQFYEAAHARVHRMVYGILNNADDADDALQNTFMKAYAGAKSYKRNAAPITWLFRIAVNESYDS